MLDNLLLLVGAAWGSLECRIRSARSVAHPTIMSPGSRSYISLGPGLLLWARGVRSCCQGPDSQLNRNFSSQEVLHQTNSHIEHRRPVSKDPGCPSGWEDMHELLHGDLFGNVTPGMSLGLQASPAGVLQFLGYDPGSGAHRVDFSLKPLLEYLQSNVQSIEDGGLHLSISPRPCRLEAPSRQFEPPSSGTGLGGLPTLQVATRQLGTP